jgi:predicted RNA-binding Zn-ribbon protein involved in translation (DUF1610 family)
MSVRQSEVDHLLEALRPTMAGFLAAARHSAGDFAKVEEAGATAVLAMRPILMSAGLERSVSEVEQKYVCPSCGGKLSRQSERERTVVTAVGEATYASVRWRCERCHQDHYPLEEANGLHGSQYTTKAQGVIAALSAEMPYAQVSRVLGEQGLPVSAKEADRTAQEVSQWRKAEEDAAIAQAFADAASWALERACAPPAPPALEDWRDWSSEEVAVISTDGGKVRSPEVGENGLDWYECRLGVIASANEKSRAHKVYAAGVVDADGIFDLLAATWRSRLAERCRALFIADGAEWIWRRVGLYFPECEQVLDIYHAAEHVASAAAALWGEDSQHAKDWRTHARDMLLAINGPKRVRRKLLAGWLSGNAVDPHALHKEIRYLFRHRRRMPYQALKEQGLPVGSGVMESAVKQVNTARLRRPGMKWTKQGADGMLRLRSAHLSGALFDTISRRHASLQQLAQRYQPNQQQLAA